MEGLEMSPLRRFTLGAALLAAAVVSTPTFAANPNPYEEENAFQSGGVYVACTLGNEWSGFPVHLMADFSSTSATEKLDVTLPLYVTWIVNTDSGTSRAVDPPQPITNFDWFDGHHGEFEVDGAGVLPEGWNWYNDCDWQSHWKAFEAPTAGSYPLNSSGQMHLEDIHGGIGANSIITLVRHTNEEETEGVRLYIFWARPGTYRDYASGIDEDFTPGETWTWATDFGALRLKMEAKIIEWVSTDYPAINPGLVTAADLGYFLQIYGENGGPVRWGLASESPVNSPTFQADVTPLGLSYGTLDGSDLSHMAYDVGRGAYCGMSSKAGDGASIETIMAWFGFTKTGNMIDIGIATVPEYVCTNPEQRLIGIRNPFGYRNSINSAQSLPWSTAKALYR
jgi:hypothetical protein